MVTITKVLKRKDGASVVVAVVIALILAQLLPPLTDRLSGVLSGVDLAAGAGWQDQYLQPVVDAALQLVLLEVIVWLYVTARSSVKQ